MNSTVTMIIGLTFGIIILMWILMKSESFKTVSDSIMTVYKNSVQVLEPSQQANAG